MRTSLVVAVAISVAAVCASCSNKEKPEPVRPAQVKTETVSSSFSTGNRSYVGQVEEVKSAQVSFNQSGTILRMCVAEGQRVNKGQLVAEMDPTQARNAIRAARAQVDEANDALKRMKVLYDNQALPEIKWVETRSKVEEAKAQLALAKKAEADCKAYSPIAGVVGKGAMETGETALPALAVATILDISSVKVRVSIPEMEIGAISATTPTSITVDALGETFAGGRIERDVQADGLTHTYDIKILVPNPGGRLLPGMVCKVEIKGAAKGDKPSQALTVPITAVQQSADGKKFVWVVQKGKAHRCYITVGDTYGNRIAVSEGLKEGDTLITQGYHKLGEGTRVKAVQ